MTSILTTAGAAHLAQLDQGTIPTNSFNGLVLGTGNTVPAVGDTLTEFGARESFVLRLSDGYPKKGDTDTRNSGRGTDVYTWLFQRAAGEPFVASNVGITNYSGGALVDGAPLAVHAAEKVFQRADERLLVWVNAQVGETPTVFTATETAYENRIQRVAGFAAHVKQLASNQRGTVIEARTIRSRIARNSAVWTAAELVRVDGYHVKPADVEDAQVVLERLSAATGQWTAVSAPADLECHLSFFETPQLYDMRWPHSDGYNFEYVWEPVQGMNEATYRLAFTVTLCDGGGGGYEFWHELEVS